MVDKTGKEIGTLIVAALIVAVNPDTNPGIAFTKAEDFMDEAVRRGYDLDMMVDKS